MRRACCFFNADQRRAASRVRGVFAWCNCVCAGRAWVRSVGLFAMWACAARCCAGFSARASRYRAYAQHVRHAWLRCARKGGRSVPWAWSACWFEGMGLRRGVSRFSYWSPKRLGPDGGQQRGRENHPSSVGSAREVMLANCTPGHPKGFSFGGGQRWGSENHQCRRLGPILNVCKLYVLGTRRSWASAVADGGRRKSPVLFVWPNT